MPPRKKVPAKRPSAQHAEHASEKPDTVMAKAYNAILERIMKLELQPGRSFTEGELAGELELSKTPVREALVILGSQGFVVPRPRSGYRVAPVTVKDAGDLFASWRMLETECAGLAATRGIEPGMVLHLKDLAQGELDMSDPADIESFVDEELDFHHHITKESGNGRLDRIFHLLAPDVVRLFRLTLRLNNRAAPIEHDHERLIDAIVKRDADAARRIAADEVSAWEKQIMDALLSSDAIQEVNLGAPLTGREA